MKNRKRYDILQVVLNLFLLYLLNFININNLDKTAEKIAVLVAVFFIINSCIYYFNNKYSLQIIVFNIIFILFCFGQIFVYLLGDKELYILYYFGNSKELISLATVYSFEFLVIFNIGLLVAKYIKIKLSKNMLDYNIGKRDIILMKYLLIFFIIITTCFDIFLIRIFLKGGYEEINRLELNNSYKMLRYFFNFYLIFLALNSKNKGILKYKLIYFLLSFGLFFLGSRSTAISLIIAYLLYEYTIENKRLGLKEILIGVLTLLLIPIFAEIRVGGDFSFNLLKEAPILIMKELGFSIIPVIITINSVPSLRAYELGKTLIDGFIRIIPLHKYYYTPLEYGSNWVVDVQKTDFGLGYSLVGEGFLNFGKYLYIFAFLVGILYGLFLIISDEDSLKQKITLLLSSQVLYFSIRSDFAYTILNLTYYVIVFKILFKIFIIIKIKRRRRE